MTSPSPHAHRLRRWLLLALPLAALSSRGGSEGAPAVDVWVDLTEPVPATAPDAAQAKRRAARVARQQREVLQALEGLGGVELGRARHTRNAIAVRIPAERLDAVRSLPGVLRVRAADDLRPPRPTPLP